MKTCTRPGASARLLATNVSAVGVRPEEALRHVLLASHPPHLQEDEQLGPSDGHRTGRGEIAEPPDLLHQLGLELQQRLVAVERGHVTLLSPGRRSSARRST